MGSRERRRAREQREPRAPRKPAAVRDAEARAALEPLGPGEVPRAVKVAVVVAAIIAVANPVLALTGYEVDGSEPSTIGVIGFSFVMTVAAVFMWRGEYWAVLGFQVLLAITALIGAVSLVFASNVQGALLSAAVLAGSGTLFWFLIRALARLQMPQRPGR